MAGPLESIRQLALRLLLSETTRSATSKLIYFLVDLAGVEPASRAPYFKAFTTILYLRLRARLAASRIRFLAIGLVIINSFVSIHYTAKYLAVQQFWLIKT